MSRRVVRLGKEASGRALAAGRFVGRQALWLWHLVLNNRAAIAVASLLWLLIRSGSQPRRLSYPCQKAAAANVGAFALGLVPALGASRKRRCPHAPGRSLFTKRQLVIGVGMFAVAWVGLAGYRIASALWTPAAPAVLVASSTMAEYPGQQLSTRLFYPSTEEAVVAFKRDASITGYGTYPYGPDDSDVYNLVFETVRALGLGTYDNPLADFISEGDNVLIKPNLVDYDSNNASFTHPAVLRPVIDMCAMALGNSGTITVADGTGHPPYIVEDQCGYTAAFFAYLDSLWPNVTIQRATLWEPDNFSWIHLGTDANGVSAYKVESPPGYPDPYTRADISKYNGTYSSSHYSETDAHGVTPDSSTVDWLPINDRLFDADVVINMPKLKVHGYYGVNTLAIKNWVGINLMYTVNIPGDPCWDWCANRVAHEHIPKPDPCYDMFKNDLLWRDMSDSYRAVLYFDPVSRAMQSTFQRKHLVVMDGIIGGERTGPLWPDPVQLGAITASVDPIAHDAVASRLMRYDFRVIPLIAKQTLPATHPIGTLDPINIRVVGDEIGSDESHLFVHATNSGCTDPTWWDQVDIDDINAPSVFTTVQDLGGAQFLVRASAPDAVVCFLYWGDDNGMPYVARMEQEAGGVYSYTVTGPCGDIYVIAQDDYFNTRRRDVYIPPVTLTVNTDGTCSGSVQVDPPGPDYDPGTTVTLTAVSDNPGWCVFAGWSGDVPSGHENDNPLTIVMDADKTITATFDLVPPTAQIAAAETVADHEGAGEIGLAIDLAASVLPDDSNLVTTESRDEGIHKLVVTFTEPIHLPLDPLEAVESIVGVNNGDVTANVVNVSGDGTTAMTIELTTLPDGDTYTVTISDLVAAGDRDFLVRALQGEVNNAGGGSQVVNALDLSQVRMHFNDDVTAGDNAKYDLVSDGVINALDLSQCRFSFTHTAP